MGCCVCYAPLTQPLSYAKSDMKLVRDFTDNESAIRFAQKLRSNGVPSYVAMFRGNNTSIYSGGPKTWAVWVLIDSQHNDALMLIKGNRHKVDNPLTESEIIELESMHAKANKKRVLIEISIFMILTICAISFAIVTVLKDS